MFPTEIVLKTHVDNALLPMPLYKNNPQPNQSTQQYFAQKIIAQYFNLTINLHHDTMRSAMKTLIPLAHSTFGVIHIPLTTPDLSACLIESFNLLVQPTVEQLTYQNTLLQEINTYWTQTQLFYANRLSNFTSAKLSTFQIEQIEQYKTIKMDSIAHVRSDFVHINPPNYRYCMNVLRKNHRNMFISVYILLYLEYIFSVSNAPQSRIDILNLIYTNSRNLDRSIADLTNTKPILQTLAKSLQATTIDEPHLQAFFASRVPNKVLLRIVSSLTMQHQFDIQTCIPQLLLALQDYPLNHLATDKLTEFELGTSLVYIGHIHAIPPNLVGLIGTLVDGSSDYVSVQTINAFIEKMTTKKEDIRIEDLSGFAESLHHIAQIMPQVEEKQRLIDTYRTAFFPWHTRYIENLSMLAETPSPLIQALNMETSFTALLTTHPATVQNAIASARFNHMAMRILRDNKHISYNDYVAMVQDTITKTLNQPANQEYIDIQLPLIWGLQHAPDDLLAFLERNQPDISPITRLKILFENKENAAASSPDALDNNDTMSEASDDKPGALSRLKGFMQSMLQKITPKNAQNSTRKIIDTNTFCAAAGAALAIILAATSIIPPIGGSVALCVLVAAIVGAVTALVLKKSFNTLRDKLSSPHTMNRVYPQNMPVNSYVNHRGLLTPHSNTHHTPTDTTRASASRSSNIKPHFHRAIPTTVTDNNADALDEDIYDGLTF